MSYAGMVRSEEYSPFGLSNSARNAAIGKKSDRLSINPCCSLGFVRMAHKRLEAFSSPSSERRRVCRLS
jgi:hypothetical protein